MEEKEDTSGLKECSGYHQTDSIARSKQRLLSSERSPLIEEEQKDQYIKFSSEDSNSQYELDTLNNSNNERSFKNASRQIKDFKAYKNL